MSSAGSPPRSFSSRITPPQASVSQRPASQYSILPNQSKQPQPIHRRQGGAALGLAEDAALNRAENDQTERVLEGEQMKRVWSFLALTFSESDNEPGYMYEVFGRYVQTIYASFVLGAVWSILVTLFAASTDMVSATNLGILIGASGFAMDIVWPHAETNFHLSFLRLCSDYWHKNFPDVHFWTHGWHWLLHTGMSVGAMAAGIRVAAAVSGNMGARSVSAPTTPANPSTDLYWSDLGFESLLFFSLCHAVYHEYRRRETSMAASKFLDPFHSQTVNQAVYARELPPKMYTPRLKMEAEAFGVPSYAHNGRLRIFGYNLPGEFQTSALINVIRALATVVLRKTSGSMLNINYTVAFIMANGDTNPTPDSKWGVPWVGQVIGITPILILAYWSAMVRNGELAEVVTGRNIILDNMDTHIMDYPPEGRRFVKEQIESIRKQPIPNPPPAGKGRKLQEMPSGSEEPASGNLSF